MQMHRHDNIIQRALSLAEHLYIGLIADGVHLPFAMLGNMIRLAGVDRAIVVSDAMAAAGLGPGRYSTGRWDVVVGEDLAVRAPDGSHLIGSAMTMRQAAWNLSDSLGLTDEEVERMTAINPVHALESG